MCISLFENVNVFKTNSTYVGVRHLLLLSASVSRTPRCYIRLPYSTVTAHLLLLICSRDLMISVVRRANVTSMNYQRGSVTSCTLRGSYSFCIMTDCSVVKRYQVTNMRVAKPSGHVVSADANP